MALAQCSALAIKHFLTDALGSTRALTDDAKAIWTRYQYEPFGETTTSGAASTNLSQYTGRENDATGLYYYRARYYHPGIKRFVREDPIGLEGGINHYAYVENDPLGNADPLGLKGGAGGGAQLPLPGVPLSPGYQPAPNWRSSRGVHTNEQLHRALQEFPEPSRPGSKIPDQICHGIFCVPNVSLPPRPRERRNCRIVCSPASSSTCQRPPLGATSWGGNCYEDCTAQVGPR